MKDRISIIYTKVNGFDGLVYVNKKLHRDSKDSQKVIRNRDSDSWRDSSESKTIYTPNDI